MTLTARTVLSPGNPASPGGKDLVKTVTLAAVFPAGLESPAHAFGRRSADESYTYTWTNHRRLETASNAKHKLTFRYDSVGRRTSKVVEAFSPPSTKETRFIYDGPLLLAEIDPSGTVLTSYLWGRDNSGSRKGASGIGGLMAIQKGGQTYFPVYDRGGNVRVLIDQNGQIQERYEYSPFGRLLTHARQDPNADAISPMLFSTKYYDFESELYDFGLRMYSPAEGKWLSRDPAGEDGGLNLYSFVDNDPINRFDQRGAKGEPIESGDAPLLDSEISSQGLGTEVPGWDPSDSSFNPVNQNLAAKLSLLAYSDPREIQSRAGSFGFSRVRPVGFTEVGPNVDTVFDAQGFTAYDPESNTALVAFRGTASGKDVAVDLAGLLVNGSGLLGEGKVHAGFLTQFLTLLDTVEQNLVYYDGLNTKPIKIVSTGHSLGGALAVLFSAYGLETGLPVTATYTFGQPPVGDEDFVAHFGRNLSETGSGFFRTVNGLDGVPRVNAVARWLTHGEAGEVVFIDRNGQSHFNPSTGTIRRDSISQFFGNTTRSMTNVGLDHGSVRYEALTRATRRKIVGR